MLRTCFSRLLLFLAAAAAISCTTEEDILPVINLEEVPDLAFNSTEGVIRYTIENPERGTSIDAVSDQDWLHDFDYSTEGEIRFEVDENTGGKRNANITVTYGNAEPAIVTISQLTTAEAGAAVITIETESPLQAEAEGGELLIKYSIDIPVPGVSIEASADEKWANHFEYPEYGTVAVYPEANFYDNERSATITLSYRNATDVTIEIKQKASKSTEAPFVINITGLKEKEVVVSWFPTDKQMTYVSGLDFKSSLDGYEGDYEKYIEDDIKYLQDKASQSGMSFEDYLSQVLSKGDLGIKWERLEPNTEYCAYAYGLDYDGTVTSRFVMERFKTKSVEQLDCEFTFEETDATDSRLAVKVTPDNSSVRYYPGIMSKTDYDSAGSDDAIMNSIVDYIDEEIWFQSLFGNWYTWADFTKIGTSEVSSDKLFSDTEYYAYAFGLEENGLITTVFQKQMFKTTPTEITDKCTFGIESEVSSSYMADFRITPSNPDTRYYVSVLATDFMLKYSLEDIATILINDANETSYDWENGKYTFTGNQNLNSYYNLDIMPLEPSTNYTLVLFGVNADGKRTTEVATEQFRTGVLQQSSMTFSLGVTDVESNKVTLTCTPSLKEELYIFGCISAEKYNELGSDEAAVEAIVTYWKNSYIYRVAYKGDMSLPTDIDIFYSQIKGNTDYYVFAFGYMGAVTTPMTKVRFTTPEGGQASGASAEITYTLRDGDELILEDPDRYQPAYWAGKAAVFFEIEPNEEAAGWYFVSLDNTLNELLTMSDEELTENIKKYGNYKQTSATVRMEWGSTIVGAAVAEDAEGIFGKPVLVEVVAGSAAYYPESSLDLRNVIVKNVSLKKEAEYVQAPVFKGYSEALKDEFEERFGHRPECSEEYKRISSGKRIGK